MPRFLNTHTGQFVWIDDPESCSYAILSHTWRSASAGGEQSYEDVRKLQAESVEALAVSSSGLPDRDPASSSPSFLTHPRLSSKIKGICKVAREAGFDLVWIDSCCIDKSSSAELSEAINSMYEWYRLADVCYAYLADVPDDSRPAISQAFWQSRWHTRGWTLQELVAPTHMVFLSRSWRFLGTKMGLAATLEQVTGIDFALLVGRASLSSFSVARRMSWAARRRTTRVEDKAYCLLGIFGIHMSPIYGEGRHAFTRLQEEIIKTIPDQSIFAWGRCCLLSDSTKAQSLSIAWRGSPHESGLLAQSPEDFQFAVDDIPLSPSDFVSRLGLPEAELEPPSLHCVFTPQGVRVRLLCLDLSLLPQISEALSAVDKGRACEDCQDEPAAHCLALLQCGNSYDDTLIAIPLCVSKPIAGQPDGQLVTTRMSCSRDDHAAFRVVRLGRTLLQDADLSRSSAVGLREVFICAHSSVTTDQGPPPALDPDFSIFLDPGCLLDLETHGFTASPLKVESPQIHDTLRVPEGRTIALSAATTLAYGTYPEAPTELIEVRVNLMVDYSLRAMVPLALPEFLGLCPMVQFSVRHLFSVPPDSSGAVRHSDQVVSPFLEPSFAQYRLREVHCADPSSGAQVLSWGSDDPSGSVGSLRNTIQTEFIIHSDAQSSDAGSSGGAFNIRVLRLALHAERNALHEFGYDSLRFWVQLTEPYPYRRMVEAGRASHMAGIVADNPVETKEELATGRVYGYGDPYSWAIFEDTPDLPPLLLMLKVFENVDDDLDWAPPRGFLARAIPCEWAPVEVKHTEDLPEHASKLSRGLRLKSLTPIVPRIHVLRRLKALLTPSS